MKQGDHERRDQKPAVANQVSSISLNADLGESWHDKKVGNDAALMPHLNSCNVACGLHGGDAQTIQQTIALAVQHGVDIGAHPSYPDRKHFGRLKMNISTARLRALISYQVSALHGMTAAAGTRLHHVKPHGALYHAAAFDDPKIAEAIATVAAQLGRLRIYGPQGSYLEEAADRAGLEFWAEGFADRGYASYNRLIPRTEPGAVLVSTEDCVRQALALAGGSVATSTGDTPKVAVKTICVHGDHSGAADRARAIQAAFAAT